MLNRKLWSFLGLLLICLLILSACEAAPAAPGAMDGGSVEEGGGGLSQVEIDECASKIPSDRTCPLDACLGQHLSLSAGDACMPYYQCVVANRCGSLTVLVPGDPGVHQEVANVFMEQYPGTPIEIVSVPPDGYSEKILTEAEAGTLQDLLLTGPVQTFAAKGVLEKLDSYIETSGHNLDDYWPNLLEVGKYEGSAYSLLYNMGVEVLYYNRDMFDETGLEYPSEDWTWDNFAATVEALTVADGSGNVERYGLGMYSGRYQLWVGQNYGSILDDMSNPSQCTLADSAALDGITFFADMMNNSYAMRDADLSNIGGEAAAFEQGKVAMVIGSASFISRFNQAGLNYDVAVVPIPNDGQRSGAAVGAAWSINANSANKDAAWSYLSWLQSADGGQRVYTEQGDFFPALRSVAESDAFLKDVPPDNRQAFIVEGENAKVGRIGYFPEWNELNGSIILPQLDAIWTGEAMPDEVLPALCEQVDAFLAEKGYRR